MKVNTELSQLIQTRCYWQSLIRPEHFQRSRVASYGRLLPIVRESSVAFRGWDFPHVDDRQEVRRAGDDWTGEELIWRDHLEIWRLYQSGQFVSLRGLWQDWKGTSPENPLGNGPTTGLPLWGTIFHFTEIYEFAARLALTEAGDAKMRVDVKIGNLLNRVLYQDNPGKTGIRERVFAGQSFIYPVPDSPPIAREALVAAPRDFAAKALVELFSRFDWNVSVEIVRSWQDEIGVR